MGSLYNKRTKVVLVDDNDDFCQAMKFLFDIENIDVTIYNNADQFLDEYSTDWSGYLLLDLLMPGRDGFSLLQELKQRNNKMFTIVISGHADKAIIAKVKELGASNFLPKPFNIGCLMKKIQTNRQTAKASYC